MYKLTWYLYLVLYYVPVWPPTPVNAVLKLLNDFSLPFPRVVQQISRTEGAWLAVHFMLVSFLIPTLPPGLEQNGTCAVRCFLF